MNIVMRLHDRCYCQFYNCLEASVARYNIFTPLGYNIVGYANVTFKNLQICSIRKIYHEAGKQNICAEF